MNRWPGRRAAVSTFEDGADPPVPARRYSRVPGGCAGPGEAPHPSWLQCRNGSEGRRLADPGQAHHSSWRPCGASASWIDRPTAKPPPRSPSGRRKHVEPHRNLLAPGRMSASALRRWSLRNLDGRGRTHAPVATVPHRLAAVGRSARRHGRSRPLNKSRSGAASNLARPPR